MEKLYDRKWIEVEEVDHADTTWGARYHLYVDKKVITTPIWTTMQES